MNPVLRLKSLGLGAVKKTAPAVTPHIKASVPETDVLTGAFVNSKAQNSEALKDIMSRQGTGSLLDLPINLIRAVPPVKKLVSDTKYKNILNSYQGKLHDWDRAAGRKLASKGKFMKSVFTSDDLVPSVTVTTNKGNTAQAYVSTRTARLSAPVDKTKHFAVPMFALYGADTIYENSKKNKTLLEEGDTSVNKAAEIRQKLMDKVASTLLSLGAAPSESDLIKVASPERGVVVFDKLQEASTMLKTASGAITDLNEKVATLEQENKDLNLKYLAKLRSQRSVKLAKDMVLKGMVKQADLKTQTDYIMELSDDNYNILAQSVEKVPLKQASTIQKGLDKVSYIVAEPFEDNFEKPDFGSAIMELSRNF